MADVELVQEIEEELSIRISDAEAQATVTVGDLCDLVVRKLGPVARRRCLTQAMFFRLRAALQREFGVPRDAIRGGVPVVGLLPAPIRLAWVRLAHRLGTSLPWLRRPRWLERALRWLAFGPLVLVALRSMDRRVIPLAVDEVLGLALACCVAALVLLAVTRPLARVPASCATVADLTRCLVARGFERLGGKEGCAPGDVEARVRYLAAVVLGYDMSVVTRDKQFVRDLHIESR